MKKSIKQMRQYNGVSQYELAKALNVSQPLIHYWETCKAQMPAMYLDKYCEITQIPRENVVLLINVKF